MFGKRVPYSFQKDNLVDWLIRKVPSAKFHEIICRGYKFEVSAGRKQTAPQTHFSVYYTGTLEIVDLAEFKRVLAEGIGSAKGYGFGLLALVNEDTWKEVSSNGSNGPNSSETA